MPRANDDAESVLMEYADLLSILSADAFKARAYEKAARAVGGFPADIAGWDVKQLKQIPGVGASIAEKLHEFQTSGKIEALDGLRARIPPGVRDMMSVPGLGPKKAMLLNDELGIDSVEALAAAVDEGRLSGVKGFGTKTEENIRRGIDRLGSSGGRVRLDQALALAEMLVDELDRVREVTRIAYAGSLRRMAETIGDVDLLVASEDAAPIMERFVGLEQVARVLAKGETKSSVQTKSGLQIDLRVVPSEVWGAALIYFTGSKAHNIRIREIAVRAGLKLSEYGLFRATSGALIVAETEEDVYAKLGLPWIPPTLREDRGEIEAAQEGSLPDVLQVRQLKGDLHTHTDLTDGVGSLEQMLAAAAERRYHYYAVTDHAPDLAMQRMTDEKMLAQRAQLERLQPRFPKMRLLHGAELNIGPDGGLDWNDEFLQGFDVLVASVHSHFTQSREEMTARLLTAIENPYVNVIGHPSTRQIGKRPPVEFDEEAVFTAAARTGTAMEINAHPQRLDLNDEHVLWARRLGVHFAVDTDAHAATHLALIRYGVATAQRGWLTEDQVINTWPRARLERFLRKSRSPR